MMSPRPSGLLDEARADGVPVDNEITLLGRINIYPNATEIMEVLLAMYTGGRA